MNIQYPILVVLQVDRIARFMNALSVATILIYVSELSDALEYTNDFCEMLFFICCKLFFVLGCT